MIKNLLKFKFVNQACQKGVIEQFIKRYTIFIISVFIFIIYKLFFIKDGVMSLYVNDLLIVHFSITMICCSLPVYTASKNMNLAEGSITIFKIDNVIYLEQNGQTKRLPASEENIVYSKTPSKQTIPPLLKEMWTAHSPSSLQI